jgi:hypothetical protein
MHLINSMVSITGASIYEFFPSDHEDPYQSVRYLGYGGSGSVDETIRKDGILQRHYARKQIRLL